MRPVDTDPTTIRDQQYYNRLWDSLMAEKSAVSTPDGQSAAEAGPVGTLFDQLWDSVSSESLSRISSASPRPERGKPRRVLRRVGKYASAPVAFALLWPVVGDLPENLRRDKSASAEEVQPTSEDPVEIVGRVSGTNSASVERIPSTTSAYEIENLYVPAVATTAAETTTTTTVPPRVSTRIIADTTSTTTTTTTTVPETTEPAPYSLMSDLLNGNLTLDQTGGRLFDVSIDMPTLCLNGIDVYGSNIGDLGDAATLDILIDNGRLSPEERSLLDGGRATKALKADISQRFDPTYIVELAEQPQEACELAIGNNRYPARWLRIPQGSTAAQTAAKEGKGVADLQPIVGLDTRSAVLCQEGNAVLAGHRTTENAPLANLDNLKPGDPIVVTTDSGDTCTYLVESAETVLPDGAGLETILNYQSPSGGPNALTVYTCDDGSEVRLVVRAVQQT